VEEKVDCSQGKLELTYPCEWEYKVIVETHIEIKSVTFCVLGDREHIIKKSNNSKGGKYQSHNISLEVHNDDDRHAVFELLRKDKNVKMVL
jgi:putative lipoic acid-binding regulatory protein